MDLGFSKEEAELAYKNSANKSLEGLVEYMCNENNYEKNDQEGEDVPKPLETPPEQ